MDEVLYLLLWETKNRNDTRHHSLDHIKNGISTGCIVIYSVAFLSGFSGLNCENNPSNITTPKSTGTNSLNWQALVNQSVSDLVNKLFPNIPSADSEKLIDQVSQILLGYSAQSENFAT